jgi:ribosomal protein S18 acetylase RimI-like enzyme
MEFFEQLGPAALGSRLRRLSEVMTSQAAAVYELYQVPFEPRWFPVFYSVAAQPGLRVGEIAARIGQTHAAVSQVVKALAKEELLRVARGEGDLRHSVLTLTERGAALWPTLQQQAADVHRAIEGLLAETRHNLWLAIEETEYALARAPLASRVKAIRDQRVGSEVRLLDYAPQYQADFKRLNVAWIEQYFQVEAADLKALEHPQEYIIEPGGVILLAEYQGEIVGACALLKCPGVTYELAKLAVAPATQGLGIGRRLCEAIIARAAALGAQRVYLESNTKLKAALGLYHQLGFQKTVAAPPSPYARCNIQMELILPR